MAPLTCPQAACSLLLCLDAHSAEGPRLCGQCTSPLLLLVGFPLGIHVGKSSTKGSHFYHLAGNVLVPVDAAGRVLELLLVLEAAWAGARPGYGLALLSPMAFNALEFAKSQLEWMAEGLTHSLERSKANPFALRCA